MEIDLERRTRRAVTAATAAGRDLGLTVADPVVLHDVFSVVVHLAPSPVVARVPVVLPPGLDPEHQAARQQRELDVVAWLAERGVPVVAPSPLVPRRPVLRDGLSMTLWELVEVAPDHEPYGAVEVERTAGLHAALADHPPDGLVLMAPFVSTVPSCLALLEATPGLLDRDDVARLREEWEVLGALLGSVESLEMALPGATLQTVHGDAPHHNVIRTTSGIRYADFEDVHLGVVEWDLASTPSDELARYDDAARRLGLRPHDSAALGVLEAARNLQAVACYALVPQLPLLAEGLAPVLEAWRRSPRTEARVVVTSTPVGDGWSHPPTFVGVRTGREGLSEEARRNLELVAGGGGPTAHVSDRPDAPWWEGVDAMTLTVVAGAGPAAVAGALGLDLAAMPPTVGADLPCTDDASPLQLVALEHAVAVVEPNGWVCVGPDVVRRLSRLGRTVAFYWSVDLDTTFVVAEDGRVVRSFDPVIDRGVGGLGPALSEEAGLEWDDVIPAAAELHARLTGVRLTRGDVFGVAHPTALVPWPV